MSVITPSHRSHRLGTERSRNIHFAVAVLGSLVCLHRVPAAESGSAKRPTLHVPATDSTPVVDGKLEEPCWKDAARTGPLKVTGGMPSKSTTEAFIFRGADRLYVGVRCAGKDVAKGKVKAGDSSKEAEVIELLIDSNGDRNSYYLVRVSPEDGGKVTSSYNEQEPPWHDRT